MKLKYSVLAITGGIILTSCSLKSKDKTPVFIQPALLDTIFNNAYEGTIPCPDCPGIETIVHIYRDSTISRTAYYQGREQLPETKIGTWKLKDSIFETTFDREKLFYKIKSGNVILRVGSDFKEVEGKLAKDYILTKAHPFDVKNIIGTYIIGDTLGEYKKLVINNIAKQQFNISFEHKIKQDSLLNCSYEFKAKLNKENNLETDLQTLNDSLKGQIKILFTKHAAHLYYKDISASHPFILCKEHPQESMQGSYKSINNRSYQQ